MALNSLFEEIGNSFVAAYYAKFDDAEQRMDLVSLYKTDTIVSREGSQFMGYVEMADHLQGISFQKINRSITAIDSQPMVDGGVLVKALGKLECDDGLPHAFHQVFVLKSDPDDGSFHIANDMFRVIVLGLNNEECDDN